MSKKLNFLIIIVSIISVFIVGLRGTLLTEEAKCDIKKLCSDKVISSELDALECVRNYKVAEINHDCLQKIRVHALHYFDDENVKNVLQDICHDDLKTNCTKRNGKFVLCILNQKEKSTSNLFCEHAIRRMAYIITADFTLVSKFKESCTDDIKKYCLYSDTSNRMVLADNTLDCLQKHIDKINDTRCKQDVLYLSEIQGEDMKLDTHLFHSCSLDKLKLCSYLPRDSSFEMFYKCLLEHLSDNSISAACQEQLLKREKLITKDARVSKGLVRMCRDDIRLYHCRRLVSDDRGIRLAQILLCLENAARNGSKISQYCRLEIMQHRKLLMQDYRLSPEVASHCSNDIEEYCSGLEAGGRTIHCLMEHSRPKRKNDRVSPPCQRALHTLLKVADAGENWRIDPVVYQSCMPVVNKLCANIPGGNARVLSCLMDNIGNKMMDKKCELSLIQLQYFISRDFKLDPQLYTACYYDAVKSCMDVDSWDSEKITVEELERTKLVLPCLFRYAYNPKMEMKLKPRCVEEVKRVMRQRAISVDLIPEVEQACMDDLALHCYDRTGIGEEMICLQEKYLLLNSTCKIVVGNYTEAEVGDINLNPVVKTHCSSEIKIHCQDELHDTDSTEDNIMECLIKHKNDADMRVNYKCRAAIEHFQLITVNDYHFTVAFKHACRIFVMRYCPKVHTKSQVVECLSEVVRNDTIKGEKFKIPKDCRYQLRSQLLQQRELIDLDPKLKITCENDIEKFCAKVPHGNSKVLECLEENIHKLSPKCHKMVFHVEQQDFTDSSSDYMLVMMCKSMIKEYCGHLDASQSLQCLKKYKDEPEFDNACRLVVIKRMMEQSLDYRLNPALQFGCSLDIGKYCMNIVKNHPPDTEFEGKVVKCLKVKFRERKLRKECEKQLSIMLKEAALNYKLNPLLRSLCTEEIQNLCQPEMKTEEYGANSGKVEECLKVAFIDGHIINRACRLEVAGLIEEAKADIHVDPLLHRACSLDINKYCSDVPQGAGRILQCLELILSSGKKHLQIDCELKLTQRIEMFRNADPLIEEPNDIGELIVHVSRSPSKKYFAVLFFSAIGIIFMFGLFCGRVTHRSAIMKNK